MREEKRIITLERTVIDSNTAVTQYRYADAIYNVLSVFEGTQSLCNMTVDIMMLHIEQDTRAYKLK